MTIPKQPRSRNTSKESEVETKAADAGTGAGASIADKISGPVDDAYMYWLGAVNSAYLNSQIASARAYLDYIELMQGEIAKLGADPVQQFWKEVTAAPKDAQAGMEAQKRLVKTSIERQVELDRKMREMSERYSGQLQEILSKAQIDVEEKWSMVGDTLRDAVVKAAANPADIPTLAMLYQYMRVMGAAPVAVSKTTHA